MKVLLILASVLGICFALEEPLRVQVVPLPSYDSGVVSRSNFGSNGFSYDTSVVRAYAPNYLPYYQAYPYAHRPPVMNSIDPGFLQKHPECKDYKYYSYTGSFGIVRVTCERKYDEYIKNKKQ
ncbi:uncharacterized protein LOC113364211 [Ctenocephalides felis]|uniref:uncharacterized protein LOC113364211 n=1 Tax=Ctenocephalides felis TaxID=7515 RepID=UPI000E6E4135|nr:uncharacterized protein LOC113364211 [Ctenocephalides felis]